jgi:hypothetical protein
MFRPWSVIVTLPDRVTASVEQRLNIWISVLRVASGTKISEIMPPLPPLISSGPNEVAGGNYGSLLPALCHCEQPQRDEPIRCSVVLLFDSHC